jgi:hypothetical protein
MIKQRLWAMACLFSVCFQSFAAFLQVQLGDVENGLECQGRFHVGRRYTYYFQLTTLGPNNYVQKRQVTSSAKQCKNVGNNKIKSYIYLYSSFVPMLLRMFSAVRPMVRAPTWGVGICAPRI